MSTSVTDLVGKLNKASKGITGATKEGVEAASLAAKQTFISAAQAVNTPKVINTSRGKKRNAWGVKYLFYTTEAKPRSVVFYFGAPPYWRESGTSAHAVNPRKKKKALLINGLFADSAHVAGVRPRPFWIPTKAAVMRQSTPILKKTTTLALVRAGFH